MLSDSRTSPAFRSSSDGSAQCDFQRKEAWLFSYFVLAPLILHFLQRLSFIAGAGSGVDALLEIGVYGTSTLVVIWHMVKHRHVLLPCLFLFAFTFIFSLSWALVPSARSLVGDGFLFAALRMVWAFYVVYYISDVGSFIQAMYRLGVLFGIPYIGVVLIGPETPGSTYLTISADYMIPLLVSLVSGALYNRKSAWIAFFVFLAFVAIQGARRYTAEILFILVLVILWLAAKKDKRLLVLVVSGGAFLSLILVVGWDDIIALLQTLFPDSRSVFMLASGDFMELGLRNYIYGYLLDEVIADPITIRGAYSDNVAWGNVAPMYYALVNPGANLEITSYAGTGAHNLFVQILFNYGVLIGGLAILILVLTTCLASVEIAKSQDTCLVALGVVFLLPFVLSTYAGGNYLDNVDIMYALAVVSLALRRRFGARKTLCSGQHCSDMERPVLSADSGARVRQA